MKNVHFIKSFIKRNIFTTFVILVIGSTLPIIVWQVGKINSYTTSASDFSLKPYPGLAWTAPIPYKTAFLQNEGTPEESLYYANGYMVTSLFEYNLSQELYSFYDTLLTSKGFVQIQTTGEPKSDLTWTASYMLEKSIAQIQYFPTPYTQNSFTFMLFFGSI